MRRPLSSVGVARCKWTVGCEANRCGHYSGEMITAASEVEPMIPELRAATYRIIVASA